MDYLGAPQTVGNPIIGMVRNILNDIRLGDIVQIMDVENAPRIVYKNGTTSEKLRVKMARAPLSCKT